MKKYTLIYVENWLSGSHMQYTTKMARVQVEESEIPSLLERYPGTVFMFEGWSKMAGESDEDVKENDPMKSQEN